MSNSRENEAVHVSEFLQGRTDGEKNLTLPGKIFATILDNGTGLVTSLFALDFFAAFSGRDVSVMRFSDSLPGRGRNRVACAFLRTNCEVLLFLDGDIRFSRSDIDRLLSHTVPIAYGIYSVKGGDGIPCLGTFKQGGKLGHVGLAENGLVELRRAGAGCMAIQLNDAARC